MNIFFGIQFIEWKVGLFNNRGVKIHNKEISIAYGPVPSRRLGQSLGINNIPPKICTYSCVYCQLGRTLNMQIKREEFYKSEKVIRDVKKKVKKAKEQGEVIDYLTFVPDGEPTLDVNLGMEIELLKDLGIKVAVITNGSLLFEEKVRNDLYKADWVSVKIDSNSQKIWRKVNRPYGSLKHHEILNGIQEFSSNFTGELVTETMLVQGVNDIPEEIEKIAGIINGLNFKKNYLAIPTRPPAEDWVKAPTEEFLNTAYQIFQENSINVEYLVGYEGNAFAFTGNVKSDLLSITSVHPMRKDGVEEYLKKANADWLEIEELINSGELIEVEYNNKRFYLRKLHKN